MGRLAGRCAIVTGGAYGIGFAAARRFAEEGASVVIADIKGHEAAAAKLVEAGHDALAITADVSNDESVDALVKQVWDRYGRINILVNNAAISATLKLGPFEQQDADEWRRIFDVNVFGVFRACRAVSPYMRAAKSGCIVNVASGTAFKGTAGMVHYVASKGAVITMTRALANEFGSDNVTVNCVSPGLTLTESVLESPDFTASSKSAAPSRFLKRDAFAPDVANVIYFLASDDSAFVTGQVIAADGGAVMH